MSSIQLCVSMEQVSGREAPGIPRKHPQVSRNPQGPSFRSPVQRKEEGSLRPWPWPRLGGATHRLSRYEGLEGSRGVILVWEGSSSSTGAGTTECAGLLPELGGSRPGMLPDSRRCPRHLGLVPSLGKPLGRQEALADHTASPAGFRPPDGGKWDHRAHQPGKQGSSISGHTRDQWPVCVPERNQLSQCV